MVSTCSGRAKVFVRVMFGPKEVPVIQPDESHFLKSSSLFREVVRRDLERKV